jgi:CheY-like chemotaxis protein
MTNDIFMRNHSVILLAEDNDDDAFFIERAFRKARLANPIKRVTDGVEAINYLEGEGDYANRDQFPFPFFLLLDLKMPKMDGFGVLKWIRENPRLNHLLVVVLTGQKVDSIAHQYLVEKAYELGANSFLHKTPNFDDMVQLAATLGGYWLLVNIPPPAPAQLSPAR